MGKILDLTGQTFEGMRVWERLPSRAGVTQKKTRWRVECFCGNFFEADTADLVRSDGKHRRSCGCQNWKRGSESPNWRGNELLSGTYFGACRRSAESRGLEFDLTLDYLSLMFQEQRGVCALTGRPLSLNDDASLDRIDSSVGYVKSNVQWVHKDFNRLKSNWPHDEFVAMCKEVAQFND